MSKKLSIADQKLSSRLMGIVSLANTGHNNLEHAVACVSVPGYVYLAALVGSVRGEMQRGVGREHRRAVEAQPRQVVGPRPRAARRRVTHQHARRGHLAHQDTCRPPRYFRYGNGTLYSH